MSLPIVWTIAGSDNSGCAGIQADLHTFQSLGVHGCSILTAITAQNNLTIDKIQYLSSAMIESQIEQLKIGFYPAAIKIGMVGNGRNIQTIINFLKKYTGPVILDPLLSATSGHALFSATSNAYLLQLKNIFPYIELITPNIPEVEALLQRKLSSLTDIEDAAHQLISSGIKNVFIKGGHVINDLFSQDYWTNGIDAFWVSSKRQQYLNYRGTGCTLSSAITACLALGYTLKDAIVISKMYINQSIRLSKELLSVSAILSHNGWPDHSDDLPYLSTQPLTSNPCPFPVCQRDSLQLYPVVDNESWLQRLLPLGIKTIQLRIKHLTGYQLEKSIKKGIEIANQYQANIFINDYWEYAIRYQAYGIHLGQDDLRSTDVQQIKNADMRLGISTHCYYEVARAHSLNPSYIACGPIFPTTSKIMPFNPQGLSQLNYWRKLLNYPLVAIGGINQINIKSVAAAGVDGIALISAITYAKDPIEMTKTLQKMMT